MKDGEDPSPNEPLRPCFRCTHFYFHRLTQVSASITARRTSGCATGAGLGALATARSATPISAVEFDFG
ncbi:MAG: hypothetical protein ACFFCH_07860 [Promethearchaeota archaeon]